MPVNLNLIDVDFPVEGEDNDSQGFRTNFSTIKDALSELQANGGYTGSSGIGYTGSGGEGYTGSVGSIGFVGSASTIAGFTGSVGTEGFTGSSGGGGGYTGSVGEVGFTGSSGGGGGYTGSVGEVGFTGSSGGGVTWSYQTTSFSAVAGGYYFVDPSAGAMTMTMPAPSDGDTIFVRGRNLDVNNLTINDNTATLITTIDTYACDILFRYNSSVWIFQRNGTINATMPVVDRTIAVFDDIYGDLVASTAVTISADGEVVIPAPISGIALDVTHYTAQPAIESNGAAYTPSTSLTQSTTTLDIDCSSSNVFYVTLTGSITTLNLDSPSDGQTINLLIKQGGSGSYTITWPGIKWVNYTITGTPVLSTAVNAIDILVITYIDIGAGGIWYGSLMNDFGSAA